MTYTPNFNDPRVHKRAKQALGWAMGCLSDTKSREWSKHELDRWFGRSNNSLGNYLRTKLIKTTDDYYTWGTGASKCKEYKLNLKGAQQLGELIGVFNITTHTHIYPIVQQVVEQEHPEIASGAFVYRSRSDRLWHPLQNLRSDIRKPLLKSHGYAYEYDIVSAAPTLIYALARESGLTDRSRVDTILAYLDNPREFRNYIAQLLNIDYATAKQIVTARFAGATLRTDCAIHKSLKYNHTLLHTLRDDPQFQQLSKDINKCWHKIKQSRGHTRLSPRHKWRIYFELENRVMRVVRTELNKLNTKYFLEHDGWRSTDYINPRELAYTVKQRTGYTVQFELKHD